MYGARLLVYEMIEYIMVAPKGTTPDDSKLQRTSMNGSWS